MHAIGGTAMGLFINHDKHPDVFKNQLEIKEPNQTVYKQDYLSEMIEKQKQANDSLRNSFRELESAYEKQTRLQSRKITSIRYNLKKLDDRSTEQKEVENDVINSLKNYGGKNEELVLKMDQQLELQQKMATQIAKQENVQHEVVNRLENQEAISEKVLRKIDDFRSILYERTNYLAEKIEKGYTSTSSYVYKMMTANKESVIQQEVKEKENSID